MPTHFSLKTYLNCRGPRILRCYKNSVVLILHWVYEEILCILGSNFRPLKDTNIFTSGRKESHLFLEEANLCEALRMMILLEGEEGSPIKVENLKKT